VERDASDTWAAARQVLREAVGPDGNDVCAIGIAGCGNGAVFVDEDLAPLRAGILSGDSRASEFVLPTEAARGQQPYPGQLGPLHDWFTASEPDLVRSLRFSLCWKDFIRAKLTGVVCSDFTDAGAAGLLDYLSKRMRRKEPAFALPQESFSFAGGILVHVAEETGLPTGTPVFTGCIDCEAAALGSGVWSPGGVSVVAGTWSITQAYVADKPKEGVSHFLINPAARPDRWLVVEGSPGAMANFDWALRALSECELEPTEALANAEQTELSDLYFIPNVAQETGAFVGLGLQHGQGDLLRAVCEGIVFAHRIHLESLSRTTGPTRSVSLSGSATCSEFWCQLFADGLGCEVRAFAGAQLGALGAAICAGIGLGIWDSVPAAQNAMVPVPVVYIPREDSTARFARFQKISKLLTSL